MFNKLIGKRPNRRPSRPEENPDTVTATATTTATATAAAASATTAAPAGVVVGGGMASRVMRGNGVVVNSSVNHVPNGVVVSGVSVATAAPPAYSPLEPLPFLRDVPSVDRHALFLAKLNLCCVIFNLGEPGKYGKEKELKRQTLLELVDHVSSSGGGGAGSKFPEAILEDLFKMISANLFRALPPSSHENPSVPDSPLDLEDDDSVLDPNWPHLQLVYELLLRYVVSPDADPKTAKKYIDQIFVLKLLDLFDSEDPRERDYLKIILHRIYGKFMAHRPFIRKSINNIFYRLIFEAESHSGISELLEILGSIVNGFALPLKEEHKVFLVRALIPLHKPKCVATYHSQLSYCIAQFVEKDSKLADTIIRGLLKYWPVTNSHKELLFLGELELVLEATPPAQFQCCMIPLYRQIGRCLNSPHFQVAERTLFLWNNEHINALISQNRKVILPLIFSALERNSRSHWNKAVNGLTEHVKKIFMDMDEELFEECQKKYIEDEAVAECKHEGRVATWMHLEALAAANQPIMSLNR